jgi:cell filamentation protein, protein adenylyltransferase
LYLSSYIIKNKSQYYKLLQEVRTKNNWEEWIIYILKAVEQTAQDTLQIIESIIRLMNESMEYCREKLPKTIYSKELIELIFMQPYTKISYLVDAEIGERRTASKYLKALEEIGVLESFKLGKEIIYVNKKLYKLLKN